MAALALAERLDMPRLASDIRTTLVGLERSVSPESIVEALRAAIDRRSRRGRRQRRAARPAPAGPPPPRPRRVRRGRRGLRTRPPRGPGRRARPGCPYAAEARWSHAVSLQAAGPLGRGAARARHSSASRRRRSTTRCSRPRGPRSWSPAATPARATWRAASAPFWRQEGLIAITGGVGRAGSARARPATRRPPLATYRLIVETLTGIWHPLFQARVRLAATTLAAFAPGAAHRSATERAADAPRSWPAWSPTRTACSTAAATPWSSWGPESRAWEARLSGRAAAVAVGGRRRPADARRAGRRPGARRVEPLRGVRRALRARVACARRCRRAADAPPVTPTAPASRPRPRPRPPAALGARPLLAGCVGPRSALRRRPHPGRARP